jgi:hypothetical protein
MLFRISNHGFQKMLLGQWLLRVLAQCFFIANFIFNTCSMAFLKKKNGIWGFSILKNDNFGFFLF